MHRGIDGRPHALRSMVALDGLAAVLRGNPVDFGLGDASGGFWSGSSDPDRVAAAIRSFRPSQEGAGKEAGEGTGPGWSLSLNIVGSFGGRIEVESQKGDGSVFTVSFPAPRPD